MSTTTSREWVKASERYPSNDELDEKLSTIIQSEYTDEIERIIFFRGLVMALTHESIYSLAGLSKENTECQLDNPCSDCGLYNCECTVFKHSFPFCTCELTGKECRELTSDWVTNIKKELPLTDHIPDTGERIREIAEKAWDAAIKYAPFASNAPNKEQYLSTLPLEVKADVDMIPVTTDAETYFIGNDAWNYGFIIRDSLARSNEYEERQPTADPRHGFREGWKQAAVFYLSMFRKAQSIPSKAVDQGEVVKEETRERIYPYNGYAPGNYNCICSVCEKQFIGDKRAIVCELCAFPEVDWSASKEQPGKETDAEGVLKRYEALYRNLTMYWMVKDIVSAMEEYANQFKGMSSKGVQTEGVDIDLLSGVDILKEIGYDNNSITSTEIWIAKEVYSLALHKKYDSTPQKEVLQLFADFMLAQGIWADEDNGWIKCAFTKDAKAISNESLIDQFLLINPKFSATQTDDKLKELIRILDANIYAKKNEWNVTPYLQGAQSAYSFIKEKATELLNKPTE